MTEVAGIDCSTQSTKVVVCDAATGRVLRTGSARHPDTTEVDPEIWWSALLDATGGLHDGLLAGVAALAVGGQQHGMVPLDSNGDVIRPALLWNDLRSAPDAAALVEELGGPDFWATAVGSVPTASFTVTKLRWLHRAEPDNAQRVAQVALPHDWLTWRLGGSDPATLATDRGDASGTGYWSPTSGDYRQDLIEAALGGPMQPPRVLGPNEPAGRTAAGAVLGPGTGDNMAAALGLGIGVGDAVVSLGTSGTAFAVSESATHDPTGAVAGFADAAGHYLPLVCTVNAARVVDATASLLGLDHAGFDTLLRTAPPTSGGLTLLPYLDGERTPNLPDATGTLHGITRENLTAGHVARAAVEGMLCGLADGLDALRAQDVPVRRVWLIGGAATSPAVRAIAADLFGVPVVAPQPGEYVALGAARQAAWVLSGEAAPPTWGTPVETIEAADPQAGRAVRERFAQVRREQHQV